MHDFFSVPRNIVGQNFLQNLGEARQAARKLIVYRDLLQNSVVKNFLELLDELIRLQNSENEILDTYHNFMYSLICEEPPGAWPDAWQRYLVQAILLDENPFSLKMERISPDKIEPSLKKAVEHDLQCLHKLFSLNANKIQQAVSEKIWTKTNLKTENLPTWNNLIFTPSKDLDTAQRLFNSKDWRQEFFHLAHHYHTHGSGIFAQYVAFRWGNYHGSSTSHHFQRILAPDPISFEDLIGYESQREQLISNTEKFLNGLPAHNLLLYGKRGTGKSSMVKALLNKYYEQGLRLVEVPRENVSELPQILSLLKNRAFYFIIFIDDLSFEDYETEYKGLKAVLEGSIEPRPQNVLLYATSNRRHLIKEYFTDRTQKQEIHFDETLQEKLSLADRFGISIFFPSPSQQVYLNIVKKLSEKYNLPLKKQELQARALAWEKWQNGLSCRTARQFIDHLIADLENK